MMKRDPIDYDKLSDNVTQISLPVNTKVTSGSNLLSSINLGDCVGAYCCSNEKNTVWDPSAGICVVMSSTTTTASTGTSSGTSSTTSLTGTSTGTSSTTSSTDTTSGSRTSAQGFTTLQLYDNVIVPFKQYKEDKLCHSPDEISEYTKI